MQVALPEWELAGSGSKYTPIDRVWHVFFRAGLSGFPEKACPLQIAGRLASGPTRSTAAPPRIEGQLADPRSKRAVNMRSRLFSIGVVALVAVANLTAFRRVAASECSGRDRVEPRSSEVPQSSARPQPEIQIRATIRSWEILGGLRGAGGSPSRSFPAVRTRGKVCASLRFLRYFHSAQRSRLKSARGGWTTAFWK